MLFFLSLGTLHPFRGLTWPLFSWVSIAPAKQNEGFGINEKMREIEIFEEEKVLLKKHLKTTPLLLIRCKCQVLLMRSKGMRLGDIGDIVGRDEDTVGRWLSDWNERRMASIFTGHKDNENAAKLTREQRKEIREALQTSPSAHTLPKEFWDVPTLKKYVETKFGIVYESDQSYYFLLKFSNLSIKYPDTLDSRRDDLAESGRR